MLKLRVWRFLEGLTQEAAARRFGLSQLTYAYIESGRLRPTVRQLGKLRAVFGDRTTAMLEPISDIPEVIA